MNTAVSFLPLYALCLFYVQLEEVRTAVFLCCSSFSGLHLSFQVRKWLYGGCGEAKVGLGCSAEFIVPCFAETAHQRGSQKLIDTDVAFCTETYSVLTNVPAVVVQSGEGTEFFLANGVKVAADGTLAQQASVWTAKGTVATVHDACNEFAFEIAVCHALAVNDGLRSC